MTNMTLSGWTDPPRKASHVQGSISPAAADCWKRFGRFDTGTPREHMNLSPIMNACSEGENNLSQLRPVWDEGCKKKSNFSPLIVCSAIQAYHADTMQKKGYYMIQLSITRCESYTIHDDMGSDHFADCCILSANIPFEICFIFSYIPLKRTRIFSCPFGPTSARACSF